MRVPGRSRRRSQSLQTPTPVLDDRSGRPNRWHHRVEPRLFSLKRPVQLVRGRMGRSGAGRVQQREALRFWTYFIATPCERQVKHHQLFLLEAPPRPTHRDFDPGQLCNAHAPTPGRQRAGSSCSCYR